MKIVCVCVCVCLCLGVNVGVCIVAFFSNSALVLSELVHVSYKQSNIELYMHNEGLNFVNRSYLFLNNFEQNYVDQLE